MVGEKLFELLPRNRLSLIIEAVADDDKAPLILRRPRGVARQIFDIISDETLFDNCSVDPHRFCDGTLAFGAALVPAHDLGVSGRIVCHKLLHPRSEDRGWCLPNW